MPSRQTDSPNGKLDSRRKTALLEVCAAAIILASNVALNRFVKRPYTVPVGIGGSLGTIALAARAGASPLDMGLSLSTVKRGLLAGSVVGLSAAAAMLLGARVRATRRFFRDERIVSAHPREAIYELFVRMPLVTAVGEELMFRSGFESLLARRRSANTAALISAAAFGLWHVLPTLDRVHSNPGVADTHQGSPARQALVVSAVLGATTLGSLGLSWLSRRTGSVVAPIVTHYAINASGFVAGWLTARAEREPREPAVEPVDG
jgi:membrane protease YdiL (CAAX protease family)